RNLLQIHEFGQAQVVKVLEMMPQCRVDFRFTGRRTEDVIVAHALFLREFDGQKEQRRVDALMGRLLEVVPAQEAKHEPKLGKAKFRAVASRFADKARSKQQGQSNKTAV